MSVPQDAFEAAMRIARSLAGRGISYAIGGALAYGQYGIPRATNDVDVNVFVEGDGLTPVIAALQALGIDLDAARARRRSARPHLGQPGGLPALTRPVATPSRLS